MPADMDEIEVQEESPKEKKKREKQEKKEAKLRAKNGGFDAAVTDDGED